MIRVERRYPIAPLAEALGGSVHVVAQRLGLSGSTWQQYRDNGVSPGVADRLACRIGRHPAELWPDWPTDDSPLGGRAGVRMAPAERPNRWHLDLFCPTCGANVEPVTVGRPTDAGRHITAVLICDGPHRHRHQLR